MVTFTQKADLVCGIFCGAHGGYETAEVRDARRNGGGRGLWGGAGKRVDGVFPGPPQSFRNQRRPMDDCSLRTRGNGAERQNKGWDISWQNGSLQKNQGWTTACSGMPERDAKDQGEDNPKQVGSSCWFGRPC